MMWWDDGGWNVAEWLLMSLIMLLLWGGLIALVVWTARSVRRNPAPPPVAPPPRPSGERADELLAERFARGEIDEDEYARRRALLHRG